jgi:two-component system, OmpR family, clock-associated histidine kinase SasA
LKLLQLLLFVDQRSSSHEQIRLLRKSLQELKSEYPFDLQVVDVGEQPYLAEHFKLVAIPTLIKIHPEPQQSLTGSNLIAQLKHSWPRWLRSVEEYWLSHPSELTSVDTNFQEIPSIACVSEIMQLSDEVLRLKQEKEQMQEQLQFKDRIIGMLAHDLRNPLTAASLALQTLEVTQKAKDNGDPPSEFFHLTTPLIKQARQQLHKIERMITDLLEASRGEKSQLNIPPQKLDIGCLCQEIV